ncbi:MAG: amidohydrolase family protein [Steroidobacteraceae bacterium]
MSFFQKKSPERRQLAWFVIALILLTIVLLNLPLYTLISQLQGGGLVNTLFSHKRLVAVACVVCTSAFAAWSIVRGHYGLLKITAAVASSVVAAFGVYTFQQHNPYADLFSFERYRDNFAILLGHDVLLSKYDPHPTLVLNRKSITRAKYPVIDVHFHFESLPESITPERLVAAMDAAGIDKVVNLGGLPGGMFEHFAKTFYAKYPDRFILFVKPDPGALMHENGVTQQVEWMKKAALMGARGIKENKSFGLGQIDSNGKLVAIDDPRLDPYWDLAGQLGLPVLVHTGEPRSFWEPVDAHNERYEELLENPAWSLHGRQVPSQQELMQQRERLLARHPGTNFIGAHFGMNPDNLAYAAYLLDKYPNYYVDMSSVVQELGREPYSARKFFIKYQDRILFGTDGGFGLQASGDGWTPERLFRSYLEFLETDNEYIEYPMFGLTKQGNWRIYGLDLPDEVLEKIYSKNAARLIPSQAAVIAKLNEVDVRPHQHDDAIRN